MLTRYSKTVAFPAFGSDTSKPTRSPPPWRVSRAARSVSVWLVRKAVNRQPLDVIDGLLRPRVQRFSADQQPGT